MPGSSTAQKPPAHVHFPGARPLPAHPPESGSSTTSNQSIQSSSSFSPLSLVSLIFVPLVDGRLIFRATTSSRPPPATTLVRSRFTAPPNLTAGFFLFPPPLSALQQPTAYLGPASLLYPTRAWSAVFTGVSVRYLCRSPSLAVGIGRRRPRTEDTTGTKVAEHSVTP